MASLRRIPTLVKCLLGFAFGSVYQNIFLSSKTVKMTTPNVTISFPGDGNYLASADEYWLFEFNTIMMFTVNVSELAIEDANGCKADYLLLTTNRRSLKIFCGCTSSYENAELLHVFHEYRFEVRFHSDYSWQDRGFHMEVTGRPWDNHSICTLMRNEISSSLTSVVGRYGNAYQYPAFLECSWWFNVTDGEQAVIWFQYFDIEYSGPECKFDKIEVWDSSLGIDRQKILGRFCGRRAPWKLLTYSTSVRIRFFSDESDSSKGFRLKLISNKMEAAPTNMITVMATPQKRMRLLPVNFNIQRGPIRLMWRIQTYPGFHILVSIAGNEFGGKITVYDGPGSSFSTIGLLQPGKRLSSSGFYISLAFDFDGVNAPAQSSVAYFAQNHMTTARTGIAVSGAFDYFQNPRTTNPNTLYLSLLVPPGYFPRFTIQRPVTLLERVTNTDECAYHGLAVYSGTVSFDNIIGPFCDIEDNYTRDILEKLIGSSSVFYLVLYAYDEPKSRNSWETQYIKLKSSKCRGFQITELMFRNGRFFREERFRLEAKLISQERVIGVEYRQSKDECVVINLLPYTSNTSNTSNIKMSLTGEFVYRICHQWRSRNSPLVNNYIEKSKYLSRENCTVSTYVSADESTEITKNITASSGWNIGFITVELGPVSDNLCPNVYCASGTVTSVDLTCGILKKEYNAPVRCSWKLSASRSNSNKAKGYVWSVQLRIFAATDFSKQLAVLEIIEISPDNRTNVVTKVTNHKIGLFRTFNFRSMAATDVYIRTMNVQYLDLDFKRNDFPSSPVIATTVSGARCVMSAGHCYSLSTETAPLSWSDAKLKCQSEGGYLVSINTIKELEFIKSTLGADWEKDFYGNDRGVVFIGLSDVQQPGQYRWEDGSPLTISDWFSPHRAFDNVLPEEPKPPLDMEKIQPIGDTGQRCVAMVPGNSVYSTNWRKVGCEGNSIKASLYSICEVEIGNKAPINETITTTEFNNETYCRDNWNFVSGFCFGIFTSQSRTSQPISSSMARYMCTLHGGYIAAISKLPRKRLLSYLTSVGLRSGGKDFWVILASKRKGCISTSILRQEALYKSRMSQKSNTCFISDGHPIHVICESPPRTMPRCQSTQFICDDGSCLNPDKVCDKHHDCPTGEDELDCQTFTYTYRCEDGTDISMYKYCDFRVDCPGGDDENNCYLSPCTAEQYRCSNGECIPHEQRCDHIQHCADESDEASCDWALECRSFKCPMVGCIPESEVSDLQPDCPDSSQDDEFRHPLNERRGRYYYQTKSGVVEENSNWKPECPGRPNYQRCHVDNSQCFPRGKACVYDHDTHGNLLFCRNGAHLTHCEDYECPDLFKCPQSYCVPPHKLCDGVQDCNQGEDESGCVNRSCQNQLRCGRSSQCVSQDYVCDNIVHCKNGSDDEMFCDPFGIECPIGCSCFGYTIVCSGKQYKSVPRIVGITKVLILDFSHNRLTHFNQTHSNSSFRHLLFLYLQANYIAYLVKGTFEFTPRLLHLDLRNNRIKHLPSGAFENLGSLKILLLTGNPIDTISSGSFHGLSSLPSLKLSGMELKNLTDGCFSGLDKLETLDLSHNSINYLHKASLSNLPRLSKLYLNNNPLDTTQADTFQSLKVQTLRSDYYAICCYVGSHVTDCHPSLNSFTSCSDLLNGRFIQVIVWTFSVLALFGNGAVIIWRLRRKRWNVTNIFVLNLSIADMLMGVYLGTLSIVNVKYEDMYTIHDHQWRHSTLCWIIGVVATVSCEMSAFTLVCIATDRTLRLAFPFRRHQFKNSSATWTAILGWTCCLGFSTVPFMFPSYFGHFYSKNSVCLPFNFADPRGNGWEFSFFMFVILNAISIVLIVAMYGLTYNKVKQTQTKARREDRTDLDVARKLTIIIMTDVICVIPVIVANLISVVGEPINRDMSAVLTAVILPVNSALNPYLFTFSQFQMKKK